MLANSVVDLIFLLLSGLSVSVHCGNSCLANSRSLIGQILAVWLENYVTRALAVLGNLIDVFISFQRLMLIKNKTFLKDVSVTLVLFVLTIFSFIYYLPVFFTLKDHTILLAAYSPAKLYRDRLQGE